jgi:predicted nucleotidyltransferase
MRGEFGVIVVCSGWSGGRGGVCPRPISSRALGCLFTYDPSMSASKLTELEEQFRSVSFRNTCLTFDVSRLSLFGSFLHGDSGPSSDVDLIVEFESPKSLISLISLEVDLSEQLGRDVDLLTTGSLSPYLRDRILEETEPVYAKR